MTAEAQNSVLVVDDEPGMRLALSANFQREGWNVETAAGPSEAMQKFQSTRFPLVITDVRMPEGDGLELLRTIRRERPATAVILLTAFGSVPEAVQAMRGGACDYLVKPISFAQLQSAVTQVMKRAADTFSEGDTHRLIIGDAPAMQRALDRARLAARTNTDVLVQAESGTGKELLARFIHDSSSRRKGPFVALNCAAVPEHLLESELFGHGRGAFTGATGAKPGKFELASGGTLLLDEIGDLPLQLQPKLLRALQEREFERLGENRSIRVDIRVIATTNLSLQQKVAEGTFRADLYYRLNVVPLSLPPLRERLEDIPLLAEFFVRRFAEEAGRPKPILAREFVEALQRHKWPGNVRELSNFLKRVVTLSDSREIGIEHLQSEMPDEPRECDAQVARHTVSAKVSMRDLERQALERALESTGGNRTRAAEMLGISLRTVRNKVREYGLPPRRHA